MNEYNCDLHYHGLHAGGVSKNMLIPVIAEQAQLKGLDVVVSADITHKPWLDHCKETLKEIENGVYVHEPFSTQFLIGTEVQDQFRVHHLIYLEDLARAQELREKLKPFGNIDGIMMGRPLLKLNGEKLAELVEQVNGIIGPAHAFTPYFGVYAHYNSVRACYGALADKVKFIELGLSADTYFADLIQENHSYNFFSFSDSHSPWPNRIGREFTRIAMKKPSFKELKHALERKESNRITLNAGLDPREGKYHATACNDCYAHYTLEQAVQLKWKCMKCKHAIKKGVRDRISELATFKEETHPSWRPPYLHVLALAEIIQLTLNAKKPEDPRVQEIWKKFVERFGNEINALIEAPIAQLKEVHVEVGENVEAFRAGRVLYYPGGGGNYGKPFICKNEKEMELKRKEIETLHLSQSLAGQKTLGEY